MPETPDFERATAKIAEKIGDTMDPDNARAWVDDVIRLVWNARGIADIAKRRRSPGFDDGRHSIRPLRDEPGSGDQEFGPMKYDEPNWSAIEEKALTCPFLHAAVTRVTTGDCTKEEALIIAALALSEVADNYRASEVRRLMMMAPTSELRFTPRPES